MLYEEIIAVRFQDYIKHKNELRNVKLLAVKAGGTYS